MMFMLGREVDITMMFMLGREVDITVMFMYLERWILL